MRGRRSLAALATLLIVILPLAFLSAALVGEALMHRVREALPLRPDRRYALLEKFGIVIRATAKKRGYDFS